MNEPRVQALVDAWFDGTLSETGRKELETLLMAEPEARVLFWKTARIHALLRTAGERRTGWKTDAEEGCAPVAVCRSPRFWLRRAAVAAAALAVAGGFFLWSGRRGTGLPREERKAIALVRAPMEPANTGSLETADSGTTSPARHQQGSLVFMETAEGLKADAAALSDKGKRLMDEQDNRQLTSMEKEQALIDRTEHRTHERKGRRRMSKLEKLIASTAKSMALAASEIGGTTAFQTDEGNWNVAENWSNGVPTAADVAIIGNARTAFLEGSATANEIQLGDNEGDGALALTETAESLVATSLLVGAGSNTVGRLTQMQGAVTLTALRIGNGGGTTGSYTLSGGTVSVDTTLILGNSSGHAVLTIAGGTLQKVTSSDVYLGSNKGVFNAYVSAGSFSADRDVYVGYGGGSATVSVSGNGVFDAKFLKIWQASVRVSGNGVFRSVDQVISLNPDGSDPQNSIELIGSNAVVMAKNGLVFGSNTTVRLSLDANSGRSSGFFRTLNTGSGGSVVKLNGVLKVGRSDESVRVPTTVCLLSSAKGFDGEFARVVWENGLSGTVNYDAANKKVWLENVVAKPSGTVLYLF